MEYYILRLLVSRRRRGVLAMRNECTVRFISSAPCSTGLYRKKRRNEMKINIKKKKNVYMNKLSNFRYFHDIFL